MNPHTLRQTRFTTPAFAAKGVEAACRRVVSDVAAAGESVRQPAGWPAFRMQPMTTIHALLPLLRPLASRPAGDRTRQEGRFEDPVGTS